MKVKEAEPVLIGGYVPADQAAKVRLLAALRGISVSALLRVALADQIARVVEPDRDREPEPVEQ